MEDLLSTTQLSQEDFRPDNALAEIDEQSNEIAELSKKGYSVIPSKTNFIFVKKANVPGKDIYEQVKKAGLLIRHFATPGIEDFVRISIGTKEQMTQLLKAM